MIDLVKRILGSRPAGGAGPEDEEREKHRVPVAACALLLEMAHIDGEFTEAERRLIVSILEHDFGLEADEAAAIMETAGEELEKSVDLWRFARLINRHYTEDEKVRVIEMIWKVIYADGRLEKHEDHLVHSLGRLLRLDHSQLIEAKLKVMDTLA
ncbi:MAG: Tellurite resistance protein TerB [Deltaproteobacteria bacterium ADurb.BinA179]|jgi:uncharacterized tellurite resistance protein B-like protein|nr:MAG: Tellurite resistance protein TerB [Deltaproteobacteria bacterium ADurb.BinA179]HNU75444.1 TerB family tellurite resistance protein [Deltaproteobacteria bacterium]HRR22306.1 TerB family tellurite resistance protein [Desulfomonilia bacterium]HOD70561.1 TerB family tellurite resistance protein [Deltaproteobacteria bacterium]HOE71517.1 TerB family tellurite resistance protein [Deltaproteobacteria bacterium]